jgi:ubiquinone/menaquinone biosynthesis C-methylase UbiE
MSGNQESSASHWKSRTRPKLLSEKDAKAVDDVFNNALVEAAGAGPGKHIIDLAAGTGDPSISIAETLQFQKGGSVTAIDLTYEMLSIARERADLLNYSNIYFAICDMEHLPFPDKSFDGATCRLGLMFPENKTNCAKEASRVIKPGGVAAYLCWGTLEDNPAFSLFAEAIGALFGKPFQMRSVRHSLGLPGAISQILVAAGFAEVHEKSIPFYRRVKIGDDYFRKSYSRTWPDEVGRLKIDEWTELIKITEKKFSKYQKGEEFIIPYAANLATGIVNGKQTKTKN